MRHPPLWLLLTVSQMRARCDVLSLNIPAVVIPRYFRLGCLPRLHQADGGGKPADYSRRHQDLFAPHWHVTLLRGEGRVGVPATDYVQVA